MFKHYALIAYRSLLKNKLSSIFNLLGLSIAIGCAIVVYLFLHMYYTMDSFHENADTIFQVQQVVTRDGQTVESANVPAPLGPVITEDLSAITRFTRINGNVGTVRSEENVFTESLQYVDADYLRIFSFPVLHGTSDALDNLNAMVIHRNTAVRHFGTPDALGKELTLYYNNEVIGVFEVAAVVDWFPSAASMGFNILLRYEWQERIGLMNPEDWTVSTNATFIQLTDPSAVEGLAAALKPYAAVQEAADAEWTVDAFTFTNLLDLAQRAQEIQGGVSGGPPPEAIIVLGLIALFLLALACFNYMNIAIATANRRLKEIGVRKAVGSTRTQLVIQYLMENVLLCVLGLLGGVFLAQFLFLPGFNGLFMSGDPLEMNYTSNIGLWVFLLILVVGVGLLSGAYPALYVSSFEAVSIFRGRQSLKGESIFTRVFLGFQFVLAFITTIAGVVFAMNAQYQMQIDWGYPGEQRIGISLEVGRQFEPLKQVMEQHPEIKQIAGSRQHIGRWSVNTTIQVNADYLDVNLFDVGFGYPETVGLRLLDGRFFEEARASDRYEAAVINQTMAEQLGWETPIGNVFEMNNAQYTVIGLVEDYHYHMFWSEIRPAVMRITDTERFYTLVAHVEPGAGLQMMETLEDTWRTMYPEAPFNSFFQDQVFDGFYRESKNIQTLMVFTAVMALLLASMGLFGMAAQHMAVRMKEVSIRKVLGASNRQLARLSVKRFMWVLGIAALLATPLSYVGLEALLASIFRYHMTLSVVPFGVAYAVVFLTAILTLSRLVYRLLHANPTDVLRME